MQKILKNPALNRSVILNLIWPFYFGVLYAVAMLVFAGADLDRLYCPSLYHHLQAQALLNGHFYLSDSIKDLQFDTAFYDGKVQQIWGLGPGLWIALFDLVGKCFGFTSIPDSIPMGCAFFLLAYYTVNTALRINKVISNPLLNLGSCVIVLLAPPLWTLVVKGPQSVYEDSSIYALVVSSAILIALIRIIFFKRLGDFWICCLLGALSGLMRPTHAIYGLLGTGLGALILWNEKKSLLQLLAGTLAYFSGLIFLFWSNFIRFGSPMEFGHRLTQTGNNTILASRFFNPMAQASVWAATKELFGALFFCLGNIRAKGDYDPNLFPGQTPFLRWRNWYVTTFDPSMLLLLIGGIVMAVIMLRRQFKSAPHIMNFTRSARSLFLISGMLWSIVSFAGIFIFMLYYPGLCARYLYDFWPGFLGLLLVVWCCAAQYSAASAFIILLAWTGCELWRADCRLGKRPYLSRDNAPDQLEGASGTPLSDFHGQYDLKHNPAALGMPAYYSFWDPQNGLAEHIVQVPVDHPDFIELKVDAREQPANGLAHQDVYRARMDNHELKIQQITKLPESGASLVRFEVPPELSRRDDMLFLCFIGTADEEDLHSHRLLHYIKWHKPLNGEDKAGKN